MAHAPGRAALVGAALAAGAVYFALAGAGTAAAKTHHGVDAPGDPFGASQLAAGYQGAGSSFTSFPSVGSDQGGASITSATASPGEAVLASGGTIVRSSGGLVSGRGGVSASNPGAGTGVSPTSHRSAAAGPAAAGTPGRQPRFHR